MRLFKAEFTESLGSDKGGTVVPNGGFKVERDLRARWQHNAALLPDISACGEFFGIAFGEVDPPYDFCVIARSISASNES